MRARGPGRRVVGTGATGPRPVLSVVLAAAVTTASAACGPAPEDPDVGELSAVVVSRNDHPVLFGGGTVDSWRRAVALSPGRLLTAFETTWPGREAPDDHDISRVVIEIRVDDLPPDDLAEVRDGRFRLSWPHGGRYVCLGNEYHDVVTTAGCVLVDAEAPAKVTLVSSIGGLALRAPEE